MNKKYEDKFEIMVICSTLNQMVNYLAIKEHGKYLKKVYNIRMKSSLGYDNKFNYGQWDKNLSDVLKETGNENIEIKSINYDYNEIRNHSEIIVKFKNIEEEKILWNITGGQRHFVMTITKYIFKCEDKNRDKDIILYFDGDREEYYYYSKNDLNNWQANNKKEKYDMNIPIALRLMGFKVKQNSIKTNNKKDNKQKDIFKYYKDIKETSPYYKYLIAIDYEEFLAQYDTDKVKNEKIEEVYKIIDKEYKFYDKFYDLYASEKNNILRKILINSNTFKHDGDKNIFDKIKEDIIAYREQIERYDEVFEKDGFQILKESIGNHNNGKVFGYILEKMTFYHIIKILKDNKLEYKISDIDISVKIKDSADYEKISNETIDEFDIFMVTKKGKVIMVECKSGGMTGDNAKSHNYSIYKIAGVYGTPKLLNPLIKKEELMDKNFKTKIRSQNDSEVKENTDIYKYIILAKNAAEKVNLDIWTIDSVETNLKEILV